ncbi:RNA 2',3'-cyclic phosphodiesterase [Paenibacillus albidus]|uniref:RNA 2',3'-cyclic phosphodiesterase n=1 Tax=Paenibacillus albidus TaxID=2041023 RepID=UPI001BEA1324|nr:RNA 2',3'-cyclic phosphodiesterase [Paenibacillus albidus]MBT2290927.1 RNA 2',3'-cyclic phosphodiesterase [Paenibacillus albidus]
MNTQKPDGAKSERLFIAVRLPEELQEGLARECRSLSGKLEFAKWVHPEDLHITLQFLGDTPVSDIPALLQALQEKAALCAPFQLAVGAFGTFGVPAAPRVLWAGISGQLDKLNQLQQTVISATLPLGFIPENREYKPHVTLARKYRGNSSFPAEKLDALRFSALLEASSPSVKGWTVDSIVVYATRMHAIPMYEVIEKITFC